MNSKNNDIEVNVLSVEGKDKIYIYRKSKHYNRSNIVILLLIVDGEKRHYTAIKSLSRLLGSSNSKDGHPQHFCLNCLQGFHSEESRDKHFECCKDNEVVRIEMPKEGSFVEFHDGQNQLKVPFEMYADFKAILKPTKGVININPEKPYTKEIYQHVPSGFCVYSKFAYGKVENPLKLYRGEDCVKYFVTISKMRLSSCTTCSLKKPMKLLTKEEWREFNRATKCQRISGR